MHVVSWQIRHYIVYHTKTQIPINQLKTKKSYSIECLKVCINTEYNIPIFLNSAYVVFSKNGISIFIRKNIYIRYTFFTVINIKTFSVTSNFVGRSYGDVNKWCWVSTITITLELDIEIQTNFHVVLFMNI